jgi:soluble lytic murein transglycosylase-like protein
MMGVLPIVVLIAAFGQAEPLQPRRISLRAEVRRIAVREGLDPRLAEALAETESGYNARAFSPRGAIGVMQLMPETAAALGVRDPWEVQENITAGLRYLKFLQWSYHGDLRLALAAYNAGPRSIAKYRGLPPYPETRKYIATILGRYHRVQGKNSGAGSTLIRTEGGAVCGGSEIAFDSRGRLYVRTRSWAAGCLGERLR